MNEVTTIHSLGKLPADRVAVTGLGKPSELTANKVRGAMAETCRRLRKAGVEKVATVAQGAGINKISPEAAGQAITEGAILGLYTFNKHKTKVNNNNGEIKQCVIVGEAKAKKALEEGTRKGRIMAEATSLARDMVNEPANQMTPGDMAKQAQEVAKSHGLEISVLEEKEMKEMGMGALLGVAQGSRQPPKFIVMSYRGSDSDENKVALVGKGITFDSGGISIKPSDKMEEMKGDMAGGASVIAAMGAIAQLKPKINVLGIVPATENLPDGKALKPGDVLTALEGKTIEIISTDAEGRLILADALGYARKQGAKYMIDIATLTGACVVALGKICTGAFSNDQRTVDRLIAASKEAGEPTWEMPMFEEYEELNKSDVADIKNVGGRYGGAITAAKFLAEFAVDTPWVHLDIAGTNLSDKERGHLVKGGTGVPVMTLVNFVTGLAGSKHR
jgi:leucyl aminopeptidase